MGTDTRTERIAAIAASVERMCNDIVTAVNEEWDRPIEMGGVIQWKREIAIQRLIGYVEGIASAVLTTDGWKEDGRDG